MHDFCPRSHGLRRISVNLRLAFNLKSAYAVL
jgi:hypothetical protein